MKSRQVQRHLVTDVRQQPVTHPANFFRLIIGRGYQQICHLKPYIGFPVYPLKGLEYRLQVRVSDLLVKLLGK